MEIHQFDPVIYPRKLWVVRGKGSKEYIIKEFISPDGSRLAIDDDDTAIITTYGSVMHVKSGKYGVLVWIKDITNSDTGAIAHEGAHVATYIFADIGAYLVPSNQEPFAYLCGWAADCIYQTKTRKFKDRYGKIQVS